MKYFDKPTSFKDIKGVTSEAKVYYPPEVLEGDYEPNNKFLNLLEKSEENKELVYDSRSMDVWALGILFLQIMTSEDYLTAYELTRDVDELMTDKKALSYRHLVKLKKIDSVWKSMAKMIKEMLDLDHKERPDMFKVKLKFEKLCFRETFNFMALSRP